MSIEAFSIALNSTMATDPWQKLILLGLANHTDAYGRGARPSQATLARYAGCGRRTVQRRLNALEVAGAIRRGDQRLTEHLRGDKRPIVWDLDLRALRASSTAPDEDPDALENGPSRGVSQTPRRRARGVYVDAHGASTVAHRTVTRTSPYSPPAGEAELVVKFGKVAELVDQERRLIGACLRCDEHGRVGSAACDHKPVADGKGWATHIRELSGWVKRVSD